MNLIGVPLNSVATRIYQGSTHGFASANFHSKVDGINGTLTVIKSTTGNIFGGFTMINWGLSATYYTDPSAFIFSLVNKMNYSSLAQNIKQPIANSVHTHPAYGPTFGGGHDIYVADQSNLQMNSHTNFGNTYALNNLTLFKWRQEPYPQRLLCNFSQSKNMCLTLAYKTNTINMHTFDNKM